ncbi:hypothetical protein F442_12725 [Phytophthora nicotianae P10297]|uniref:Uncharacterized protein n=1 Tax=Phytophthora nicotianae P10297 TaxID=1317064 RepID=W2Z0W7_PHYNI|nr:hypothetical protein F442_12725 [Phytophthora nicotianae P10297]
MSSSCFFIAFVCAFTLVASGFYFTNGVRTMIDGTVKLYSGVYYDNPLLTININYPNQCYNIDCNFLANKVESARWGDLPTTGIDGKAYIVFYAESGCEGNRATITLPHNGGIRDFSPNKVQGVIKSFAVLSVTKLVDNGFSNICMWTGSNVVGGYVSQSDTLHMVNATVS